MTSHLIMVYAGLGVMGISFIIVLLTAKSLWDWKYPWADWVSLVVLLLGALLAFAGILLCR